MERLDPIPTIASPVHPLPDPRERVSFRVTGPLVDPPRAGIDWNNVLDAGLFVTLLVVGSVLLYFREELKLLVFGEIFLNAGVSPLILCSWALVLGSSVFRRQNLLKAFSAAVVFSAGYSIVHYEEGVGSLLSIFAPACLELGVVFLISKFFFMSEDAELQVEHLQVELAEARRSPGVGLAMSYYFNFLLPTCANLAEGVVGTEMSVGGQSARLAAGARFYVFVPRALEGKDLKQVLRDMQQNEGVVQGKPVESGSSHRPLFVFLLEHEAAKGQCGFCFDIPTVIASCAERARMEKTEEARERVAGELVDFQNELVRLVSSDVVSRDRVAVVSVPPRFDAAALLHIARVLEQ